MAKYDKGLLFYRKSAKNLIKTQKIKNIFILKTAISRYFALNEDKILANLGKIWSVISKEIR